MADSIGVLENCSNATAHKQLHNYTGGVPAQACSVHGHAPCCEANLHEGLGAGVATTCFEQTGGQTCHPSVTSGVNAMQHLASICAWGTWVHDASHCNNSIPNRKLDGRAWH